MSEKIILGYWKFRGLGHLSRLLLAYTGLKWENVMYDDSEQWFNKDKETLGIPFPNLPYLIDGDFKIAESKAVNLYIILKSGKKELLGKDIKDQVRVESVIGVVTDIKNTIRPLVLNPKLKDSLSTVLEKVEPKLKQLDEFYGNKDFALGYLTLADFHVTDLIFYLEKLSPELYGKYPFLAKTLAAFNSIPEIKKYEEENAEISNLLVPKGVSNN